MITGTSNTLSSYYTCVFKHLCLRINEYTPAHVSNNYRCLAETCSLKMSYVISYIQKHRGQQSKALCKHCNQSQDNNMECPGKGRNRGCAERVDRGKRQRMTEATWQPRRKLPQNHSQWQHQRPPQSTGGGVTIQQSRRRRTEIQRRGTQGANCVTLLMWNLNIFIVLEKQIG